MTRLSNPGSGSVLRPQLNLFEFIGTDKAAGMLMVNDLSLPPASSTRIFFLGSSPRRLAMTQPAEPAPITI